jgi:hypothetical protein
MGWAGPGPDDDRIDEKSSDRRGSVFHGDPPGCHTDHGTAETQTGGNQ